LPSLGSDTNVKENLDKIDEVFLPCVVIGELSFGARKSERVQENLARIEDFAANNVVLGCDSATARIYGKIKNVLRSKGNPIPENDIWIAAIALQYDLILVTRDAHFKTIDNLKIVAW